MPRPKKDNFILTKENYSPGGGGGGPSGPVNLTDIINAVNTSPSSFYVDTSLKQLIKVDIDSAILSWSNSASNPFSQDIIVVKNDINTIKNQISNLQTDLGTVRSTLNNYIATTDSKITNISNDISGIKTNVTKIVNGVDLNLINLKTIDTRITNINGQITAINSSISNLSNNLTPRVNKLEGDYTTLSGNVTTNTNSINTLVTDLATYITTNNAKVGVIEGNVTAIQNKLTIIDGDITTIKTTLTDHSRFFDDPTSTLTITQVTNSLNNLSTKITTLETSLTDLNNRMIDAEGKITDLETWKVAVDTELAKITQIDTRVTKNTTDIASIVNQINGSLDAGFISHTFLYGEIIAADNKKTDGSDWIGTSAFTTGPKISYNTVLPVVLSRINELDDRSGPSEARLVAVENKTALHDTKITAIENDLISIETQINKIPVIEADVDTLEADLSIIKDKTQKLDIAGELQSTSLLIDQTTTSAYNNSSSGASYIGDELVKETAPYTRFNIEDVLKAFYKRIDNILTTLTAIDITQIRTDLADVISDLADHIIDYDAFVLAIEKRIDELKDENITNTIDEAFLNEYEAGKNYSGTLAFNSAANNTIKQNLEVIHKRIFEIKTFMEKYINEQILDTKIDVTVDRDIFNKDPLTGTEIQNTDPKYLGATENLKKCLEITKLYINEIIVNVEDLKKNHFIAFKITDLDPLDPDYLAAAPYQVEVAGRLILDNKSIFNKLVTFKDEVIFENKINVNSIYVGGKELNVIRKTIPGTLLDTTFGAANNLTNATGFHYKEITPSLPGLTVITPTYTSAPVSHKTSYVVEALDNVTVYAYYSLLLDISNTMTAGNAIMINYFIQDNTIANTRLAIDQYISKIQGVVAGKTYGIKYDIFETTSVSNQAVSSDSLSSSSKSWAGVKSFPNIKIFDTPTNFGGAFTPSLTPSYSNTVHSSVGSSQLFINPNDSTDSLFQVSTGMKTLAIFEKPTSPIFLNVGVQLKFEKMNF